MLSWRVCNKKEGGGREVDYDKVSV